MYRNSLIAFLALVSFAVSAFAQTPDDLRGTWAVQADGRNLIVLHLEGEAQKLTGTMTRPIANIGAAMPAGSSVSQVKMPLLTVQVREVRAVPAGRVFSLRFETADAGEIVVRSSGVDRARFGRAADAPESSFLPMVRVSDTSTVATDWDATQTYLIRAMAEPPNQEMAAIFAADQADRQGNIDWSVVGPRDEARRSKVRALLDAGQLRAADDYYGAAFVFQHGDSADDCLLAHVLAMAAMTLGRNDASWIATATLDRYLQRIDRSQIFGTQYVGMTGSPMTQGKYDTALIPDALRGLLRVPTIAQQQEQLKRLNAVPPATPARQQ